MTQTPPNCPICRSQTAKINELDNSKIRKGLSDIFDIEVPETILQQSYQQRKCSNCTLEFSWPLLPGSSEFYNFLTKQAGYYTNYRPEYKILWDILKTQYNTCKILDVGCGNGSFLAGTLNFPNIEAIGIDTTFESIEAAKGKGVNAFQTTIENLEMTNFDLIVSFHCLEHVADPVQFVNSIKSKLKPGGVIYISTPYSPVSYEYFWLHPLNHPPHHLLRFNKKAYKQLAEQTTLIIEFINFEKMSFLSHFASCFSFAVNGKIERRGLPLKILLKPFLSIRIIIKLLQRGRLNGAVIGNDLLVKLSPKD